LKLKLPSLCNLKSLKVKIRQVSYDGSKAHEEVDKLQEAFKVGSSSIPDGIVDFLLQNSPSAEVHIIK
jgi:hypothetical protein